jgi:transposase InsO family protein
MPWKVSRVMDAKMEFISRLNGGERMTDLCREYGIARKTGHKLQKRFATGGVAALAEHSRAPRHVPHRTSPEVAELVTKARREHPGWGPKKLKDVLEKRLQCSLPSSSTIGTILDRAGLVERRRQRPRHASPSSRWSEALAPNDLWCIDYKGQFRLGDQSLCYPLTLTDQVSRYILACDGMAEISDAAAQDACQEAFRDHGLPYAMRSDNGTPFASVGLAGLTCLSVYWLRLGIRLERSRPAHPEDNGRHERMHRTLKRETTRPARQNLLQQQERFDEFVEEFNQERPHEALGMQRPAEVYRSSSRIYPATLPEPTYPTHDDVLTVRRNGFLPLPGRGEIYLAKALHGQQVGVREEDDGRWLVTFMTIDLGHVDRARTFTPTAHPPEGNQLKVLPMYPV